MGIEEKQWREANREEDRGGGGDPLLKMGGVEIKFIVS